MRPLRSCERLIDTNPLLRVLLPFMSGIGVAEWTYPFLAGYSVSLYVAAACSAVLCFWKARRGKYSFRGSVVYLLAFYVGLTSLGAAFLLGRREALQVEWPESPQTYRAVVVETPREKGKTFQVVARLYGGTYDGRKVRLALMKPDRNRKLFHKDSVDNYSSGAGNHASSVDDYSAGSDSNRAGTGNYGSGIENHASCVDNYSAGSDGNRSGTGSCSSGVENHGSGSDNYMPAADKHTPKTDAHSSSIKSHNSEVKSHNAKVDTHGLETDYHRHKSEQRGGSGAEQRDEACEDNVPRVGDLLLFDARMETPRNAGNPGEFDYAAWLRHQDISGTAFCFSSQWRRSEISMRDLPVAVCALRIRDRLVAGYARFFDGRDLGLLSAMTLGDRTGLDVETRDMFSRTGVSHVLALSGLHLGILFAVYNLLVLSFCRRRWVYVAMSFVGIACLWLFAFLAGLPLSLLRAASMFTVMQLSVCLRRDCFSVNNLALAALLLLLVSPQSLFDVGFQLSFLAVFFIQLLPFSSGSGLWHRLRGLFVVSLAAQLGTMPLVAYYFHVLPVYGLLTQFVAVPLTYLILVLAVLFLCIPFLRIVWVPALGLLLAAMQRGLAFFADLPGAVLTVRPTVFVVVSCYAVLALSVAYALRRRPWPLYGIAAIVVLGAGIAMCGRRARHTSPRLVFYNLRTVPAVHAISSARCSYLWSERPALAERALASVRRTYWEAEGMSAPVWLSGGMEAPGMRFCDGLLCFGTLRVALPVGRLPRACPESPLQVDYLLLSKGTDAGLDLLLRHFRPASVVLDSSLPERRRRGYELAARACGLDVHDMCEEGALVVEVE